MTGYSARDAAKDTDSTIREVKRAHHDARTESEVRTDRPDDRPTEENQRAGREMTERVLDRARARESDRERAPESDRER